MSKQLTATKSSGFTLIELMITVAIVAIIAAVAYPSYIGSVTKTRRADAQAVLMGFAQAMERHYTERNSYEDAGVGNADTGAPGIYAQQAPIDGTQKYYDLTIEAADATTYTLRATPINGQVGDGFLEITNTGQKRWDSDDSGGIGGGENAWRQ